MRTNTMRWRKGLQTFLNLETLEARTPVSEGIGPGLTLSALGRLARSQTAPPPNYPASYGA